MSDKTPRISVIMMSFNTGRYLVDTLETLVNQSYENWELIAVDGGSTDNTLEILRDYKDRYPGKIIVISEPDEGPYDAFHKGLKIARGEFVYEFPISDGFVDMDWMKKCVDIMDSDPEISLVWGIPVEISEDGSYIGPNYIYGHFLEEGDTYKHSAASVFKEIFKKLNPLKPKEVLIFFKKVNSKSMNTFRHMLKKQEGVPQKQEWFKYWLKTGQIYPDANMCVAARVMRECLPPYTRGTREPGDWMGFYFNFNSRGYLSYCIPTPANYGRIHGGQISEVWKRYNDKNRIDYYKKLKAFKRNYRKDRKSFVFRDRNGDEIKR